MHNARSMSPPLILTFLSFNVSMCEMEMVISPGYWRMEWMSHVKVLCTL